MINKLAIQTLSLIAAVTFSGCATIMGGGGPQKIRFTTTPDQAEIYIYQQPINKVVYTGTTPSEVRLERSEKYFKGRNYDVVIKKPGYKDIQFDISSRVSGWYIGGNIIFGGLIGWLIVDPASGAMWTLTPKKFEGVLESNEAAFMKNMEDGIHIALLPEIPKVLTPLMVPIHQ